MENNIRDNYHTMNELYEHRNLLYINLLKAIKRMDTFVNGENGMYFFWRTQKDNEGNFDKDWFILGIDGEGNKQITYHLPISMWGYCDFAQIIDKSIWNGHTSADVLELLKENLV